MQVPLLPEQASATAVRVDHLYYSLTAVSTLVLIIIFVPMLAFLWRYRRGNSADRSPVRLPTMKIEIAWTIIPLLLAIGMFAWGANIYFDMEVPPAGALEINVVGK